jgi:hypothetical protein
VPNYGVKKVQIVIHKYTLDANGLTLGKIPYRAVTGQQMKEPKDSVYFCNENNWVANNTKNIYAFSIEK